MGMRKSKRDLFSRQKRPTSKELANVIHRDIKAGNILRLHAPGAGPLRIKVSRGLSQRLIS